MALRTHAGLAAAEVARVRAHFGRAQSFVAANHATHDPIRERARKLLCRELEGYRDRGRFPQNRDFPDRRMPYFVDADGTLCAVAHLMSRTGAADLVTDIARTRNHARVPELANDARVAAWLEEVGLSVEEAARIQPTYVTPGGFCLCLAISPVHTNPAVWVGTVVTGGSTVTVHVEELTLSDAGVDAGLLGSNLQVTSAVPLSPGTRVLGSVDENGTKAIATLDDTDGGVTVLGAQCLWRDVGDRWENRDLGVLSKEEALGLVEQNIDQCEKTLLALDPCWFETRACTFAGRLGLPPRSNGFDASTGPERTTTDAGVAEATPVIRETGAAPTADTDAAMEAAANDTGDGDGGCNSSGAPAGGLVAAGGVLAALAMRRRKNS